MGNYSMPRYFQNMPVVGKPVKANAENATELRAIEDDIHAHVVKRPEGRQARRGHERQGPAHRHAACLSAGGRRHLVPPEQPV